MLDVVSFLPILDLFYSHDLKKLPTLKQPHAVQPTESYNLENKHQMWNVMATFGWLLFVRFIFHHIVVELGI